MVIPTVLGPCCMSSRQIKNLKDYVNALDVIERKSIGEI